MIIIVYPEHVNSPCIANLPVISLTIQKAHVKKTKMHRTQTINQWLTAAIASILSYLTSDGNGSHNNILKGGALRKRYIFISTPGPRAPSMRFWTLWFVSCCVCHCCTALLIFVVFIIFHLCLLSFPLQLLLLHRFKGFLLFYRRVGYLRRLEKERGLVIAQQTTLLFLAPLTVISENYSIIRPTSRSTKYSCITGGGGTGL